MEHFGDIIQLMTRDEQVLETKYLRNFCERHSMNFCQRETIDFRILIDLA